MGSDRDAASGPLRFYGGREGRGQETANGIKILGNPNGWDEARPLRVSCQAKTEAKPRPYDQATCRRRRGVETYARYESRPLRVSCQAKTEAKPRPYDQATCRRRRGV